MHVYSQKNGQNAVWQNSRMEWLFSVNISFDNGSSILYFVVPVNVRLSVLYKEHEAFFPPCSDLESL